jgi:hypothetical protein
MPPELENMDPAMMAQIGQAFQRLPRGQMQRFQSLMQRAMAGQDVTREAEALERTLPPEFKSLMGSFAGKMGLEEGAEGEKGAESAAPAENGMSEEEARRIVEAAAAEGKLSQDQASELLKPKSGGMFGKFFGKKKD